MALRVSGVRQLCILPHSFKGDDTLKKSLTTALVLTVIMAFMELTGLPAALLPDINIADINPIYFLLALEKFC